MQRKLCIKKDLIELSQWMEHIEHFNTDLDALKTIEKQMLHDPVIERNLVGLRRKNTLVMGSLCKYEKELNKEFEYGKRAYDIQRAKEHEKRRGYYAELMEDFQNIKNICFKELSTYRRN